MYGGRAPSKPLIWAGRICATLGVLLVLVGVGLWTGVAGQVVDQNSGENHASSIGPVLLFGGLWGLIVGFFTIRAGRRRDII